MEKRRLLAGFIPLAAAIALGACGGTPAAPPVVIQGTAVPPVPTLDPEQVAQGEALYQQYCAACHGAALQGQPDWQRPGPDGALKAPPHDSSGHTWHHPDDLLATIIAQGGDPAFKSAMPAFGEMLDDQEIRAVLAFIKRSWGPEEREFQWWITAR